MEATGLCPSRAALPWCYLPSMIKPERELGTALPHIERQEPEHVLVLNTSGFMLTIYTWDTLNYLSKRPVDAWVLSSACGKFSLEKTGEASFVIRTDRSGWLDNMFARLLRVRERLEPGRRYETEHFTATLEKLITSGKDVLSVRFDLRRPLDDPGWMFLRWNGEAFEPLNIAAMQTGATFDLADTSDIWKAMY